jgi:hypothetical protein
LVYSFSQETDVVRLSSHTCLREKCLQPKQLFKAVRQELAHARATSRKKETTQKTNISSEVHGKYSRSINFGQQKEANNTIN